MLANAESEGNLLFYLDWAVRLRAIAAGFQDGQAKADLLEIADRFELLAHHTSAYRQRRRQRG